MIRYLVPIVIVLTASRTGVTAAELAETTAGYFHELGCEDPKLNERLVRFYVQKRVINEKPFNKRGEATEDLEYLHAGLLVSGHPDR